MIIKNEDILIQNGNTPELRRIRKDILTMISEGISSVNPYYAVQSYIKNNAMLLSSGNISLSDFSNIYLVSFGKASIGMAQAVVDLISIKKGVIITHIEDSSFSHENIQLYHGHHPIPNEGSVNGTKAIEQIVSEMNENDLLLVLISGGGSALLCHPRIPLKDMQDTTILLLRSGATIQDVNTIRKHLSFVKGGQLIKSVKGTVISLIISDVIGDPLSFIASGPTVGDETTFQDVNDIFSRYQLWDDLPRSTRQLIHKGINNEIADTPNTSDPIFKKVTNEIIANNSLVCKTVYATAKKLGYKPFIFSTAIQGEAKEVAKKIISRFLDYKKEEPCNLFITGGETTVTVNGQGKGGRNQEMVLALLELVKKHNLVFTSIGTDGIDGMSDAAGAIADPYSLEKARGKCIDPLIFLNNNDSNSFFKKMEDTVITGPTGTNVMDIQIVISLE